MASESPENEAIALRMREPQRRDKQKYRDQDGNRIYPERSSDRIRSGSGIPSSGESDSYHGAVPRSLRKRRTSSSTRSDGASISSRTYENVIDDLSEPEIHKSHRTDDFDSSSDLRPSRTAPAPNYSYGGTREQRRAFSNEQSHQLSPLINPERQHGAPTLLQKQAARDTQERTNPGDNRSLGSWNHDTAYQTPNEPDYATQTTAAAFYDSRTSFPYRPTAPQPRHSASFHHHQWNQVSSSQPVHESTVDSLNSQLADTTLDLPEPGLAHSPPAPETPEYGAATTTEYSSNPVVVDGVETSARIVRQGPITPDASRVANDPHLRPSFNVRRKEFFVFGKVLKVWWAEPAGKQSKGATIVTGRLGEGIATKLRWFVVIRRSEFCSVCLPIQTYQFKGVSKAGITKCQHAIIYTCHTNPYSLPEESPRGLELPMKQSICVQPTKPFYKFDQMSRINYAKAYTIEHNVRVEDFGMVIPAHHYLLEISFRETLFPRIQMGNFPMGQGDSASRQSDFVGIGAHSHHQISGEQNTSLEDRTTPNPSYFSASTNPPTRDPAGTYYATGKDRETSDLYTTPELGVPYTSQSQQQYYSQPTDPFTTGYDEASPARQGPIGDSQAHNQGSYGPSLPLLGPTGPPQGQYHGSYGAPPPSSGPIAPAQAQYHDSYGSSPSYGDHKRQSRHRKGRKW